MTAIRLILLCAAVGVAVAESAATTRPIPLPRPRPELISAGARKHAAHFVRHNSASARNLPVPSPTDGSLTASIPASGVLDYRAVDRQPNRAAFLPPQAIASSPRASGSIEKSTPSGVPLAIASTAYASPSDLAAVKQAIDLANKGRNTDATNVEGRIADPLARKLVEWVILRSDDGDIDFSRYAAFVAANPSWPGIIGLRRRGEAALWQQDIDPRATLAFFRSRPPLTAKGRFALARALLAEGDRTGAGAAVRAAWRRNGFSAKLETEARERFAGLITAADDKARMDARLYAEDRGAGMRAARHLDAAEFAIARARVAIIGKAGNARALLDAVPAAARRDPGYMLSRIQWLRRHDNIAEAARWLFAAPREPAELGDRAPWWIERRIVARKLLDLGDFRTAYKVAADAATPTNENYRGEQQFTAGWIALRFLRRPELALAHFTRIGNGVSNPITLARGYYWQGRAAEALGRRHDARSYYERAARYSTAYYGQLARARLGLGSVALQRMPEPPVEHRRLEVARAFEILYDVNERNFVAVMAADLADKTTDAGALAQLADIATRHRDARATMLIGKIASGRGLPLERYAFPAFGIPTVRSLGPAVERCVIYSIARQESAFNPHVVSAAHAFGLMQVTPDAGRFVAKKFRVAFSRRRLLDDPAYNVQIGSAELGDDINHFNGSYILAFASYNAGRRRVGQWIAQYGDPRDPRVDPVDWIERIPFAETRNYVERVIENMQVYRARINNDSRLLIEADLHRGG